MSSCSRRIALIGLTATVAGCGFTPVYGPGGAGQSLTGTVTLQTPETSDGFTLRQRLQERIGPVHTPTYALVITLATREDRVAITTAQDTRRFNVVGEATYRLTHLHSGQWIARGQVDSFTSFAATGTTVATQASEQDAYRRLMIILADKIMDRLLLSVSGPGA